MKKFVFLLLALFFNTHSLLSQHKKFEKLLNNKKNQKILKNDFTKSESMKLFEGFFNFYYDDKTDNIFLMVKDLNKDFLYVNSLSQGIGNNDIGLDRGQLGKQRVVYFTRSGNRLLLVEPNQKFRANSENYLEKESVDQAFAKSVIWSFKIEKITEKREFLIDLNDFLLNDTHEVANKLKRSGQGYYSIDKNRSSINLPRTKSFIKNTEFDVQLTYSGQPEGDLIRSVTPSPNSVTINQHHSFIELPPLNFKMRRFDPRSGVNAFRYYDYATPVSEPTLKEYVVRHRLEKKNPELEMSEAIKPIIYYLDNGTPEPVRSALIDGGKWWNEAFENIGFKNAFQIKILPDDVDPLDVRFNVIQWIHRSTRGWSYGSSIMDPRTGEILKGHVSLGSLRIRQDFMIALGLTKSPYKLNENKENRVLEMALARIRQLSAHEIGHTLGFAHNFTGSSNDRSTVMDYPHPTLKILDGQIDYKDAYSTGIGEWDKVSVAYNYSQFLNEADENTSLKKIIENSFIDGHRFISDSDSRPLSGAHPKSHLWDNGENSIIELENLLTIRELALSNFSIDHIKEGENYSILEDRLVPMYFLHRYQLEAVVKLIGGLNYDYGVKGNIKYKVQPVKKLDQDQALKILLKCISPINLKIPKSLHSILGPRTFGNYRNRESFGSQLGITFDYLGIANSLSNSVISMILNPERSSRLVQHNSIYENQLSLNEVILQLINKTFKSKQMDSYSKSINEINQANVLKNLFKLGSSPNIYPQVRAIVFNHLDELNIWLNNKPKIKFSKYYQSQINTFMSQPILINPLKTKKIPDGSPIGSIKCDF
jgi:hypothetical protein